MSLSGADSEHRAQPSAIAGDASSVSIPPTAQPQPAEAGTIRQPADRLVWLPMVVVLVAMSLLLVAYGQYRFVGMLPLSAMILAVVTTTRREEIAAGIYPLLGYPCPYPGRTFRLMDFFTIMSSLFAMLIGLLLVAMVRSRSLPVRVDRAPQLSQQPAPQLSQRRATLGYWQTAVANLHVIRFQTPTGQEPAEQYYQRLRQELKRLTSAARSAPTSQVDADLVKLVTRHLEIDDLVLGLFERVAQFTQDQQFPVPTDSVDQRMQLSQTILRLVELQPELLDKLPAGPAREFLEEVIRLESLQDEQFREIEVMQAVLQERYRGLSFPLPTPTQ